MLLPYKVLSNAERFGFSTSLNKKTWNFHTKVWKINVYVTGTAWKYIKLKIHTLSNKYLYLKVSTSTLYFHFSHGFTYLGI